MESLTAETTANPPRAIIARADLLAYGVLALGVLAHLAFLVSLRTGWLNPIFNDSMHRFGPGCDFFSIYAAGVKSRLGESVYTIGGHVELVPYAYAFRYAPLVAQSLGAALTYLSGVQAYGLWLILCELALLRSIRLTVEMAPDRRTACLAAGLWLLFSPYYLELYVGQFTFLTATLVFWAYVGWQRERGERREERVGRGAASKIENRKSKIAWFDCLYIVAVLLKMFPLLFAPIALLRGRWKSLLVAVGLLAWTSWGYFNSFPADWGVFMDTNARVEPTWHAGNHGLMALLYALAGEQTALFLTWRRIAIALVGTALLWLVWRAFASGREERGERRGSAQAADLENRKSEIENAFLSLYVALSSAYLLCYKDVWEHHYTILLPCIALMVVRRWPASVWLPAFVVAATPTLFRLYDVPMLGYNEDPQRYWRPAVSLLHHGWKPLCPLWLTGAVLLRSLAGTRLGAVWQRMGTRVGGRRLVWSMATAALALAIALPTARWASAAIADQAGLSRELAWPEGVFEKQKRQETCGPAALATVCRHYGIAATEEEIAALAGTTKEGTSMERLAEAARAKGLACQATHATADGLARLPAPSILFYHAGHFAVLTGVRNGHYYLADPSLGQRVWSKAELMQYWSGVVLLVGPGER